MKIKKINLNWQSVLLGMALCLVLVVFIGGKANAQQNLNPEGSINLVTSSDLLAKSIEMQKEIVALSKNLIRIEQKIAEQAKDSNKDVVRIEKKIDAMSDQIVMIRLILKKLNKENN